MVQAKKSYNQSGLKFGGPFHKRRRLNQFAKLCLINFSKNLLASNYAHIGFTANETDHAFSPALLGFYQGVSIINLDTLIANFRICSGYVSALISKSLRPSVIILDSSSKEYDFYPEPEDFYFVLSYYIWGKWPNGLLTNNLTTRRCKKVFVKSRRNFFPYLPAAMLVVGSNYGALADVVTETSRLGMPAFFFSDSNIGLQLFRYWIPFNLKSNYSKLTLLSLIRALLLQAGASRMLKFLKKLTKVVHARLRHYKTWREHTYEPKRLLWNRLAIWKLVGERSQTRHNFYLNLRRSSPPHSVKLEYLLGTQALQYYKTFEQHLAKFFQYRWLIPRRISRRVNTLISQVRKARKRKISRAFKLLKKKLYRRWRKKLYPPLFKRRGLTAFVLDRFGRRKLVHNKHQGWAFRIRRLWYHRNVAMYLSRILAGGVSVKKSLDLTLFNLNRPKTKNKKTYRFKKKLKAYEVKRKNFKAH